MSKVRKEYPHSIRCLQALEGYCGGRANLADKMGITTQTISQWKVRNLIARKYVLDLVDLGDGKFTAEEFLGKFDGEACQ